MKNKNLLFSALIYFIGMLFFLVCDIYISANFSDEIISNWAFYKSLIIVVGSLSLFGYDQVFIRNQNLIKSYRLTFVRNLFIISLLTVIIVFFVKNLNFTESLKLFISIISFSFLTYLSSGARANNNLWKSQFINNFWKVLILIFLLSFQVEILDYFVLSFIISLLFSFILKGYFPKENEIVNSNITTEEESKVAKSFFYTSLTLLFTIYGEQIIINMFKKEDLSSEIFIYYSIFTPITLSVNGFLGFILAPKIRRLKNFNVSSFKKMNYLLTLTTLVLTIFSFLIGFLYFKFIAFENTTPDIVTITLLFLICIVRGIYTATSVCLGVFGNSISIRKTAYGFWIGAILNILIIILALVYETNNSLYFILIATLINWLIRLSVSNFYSINSLKFNYETK